MQKLKVLVSWRAPVAWGFCLALASAAVSAQVAGQVEFSRGVGFAQANGESPRVLGRGLVLREGDRLTTAASALAVVKFEDGTRMTLRPDSEIVLQHYRFTETALDNAMLLQLVRGGFRVLTGLITKNSPNAARIQTGTATIGIRGTDFDARLCGRDCGAESARITEKSRPNTIQASARVIASQGMLNAVDASGQRRRLVDGAGVYPGDLVETGGAAWAVMAFRDESRVTLGAGTRFRVDHFVYDNQNAGDGRFLVSLLKGSVRALTGLIAKANNRNVGFSTATATIGVRGTLWDMNCLGACAGEPDGPDAGLTLYAWLGTIAVTPTGGTAVQLLSAGQGLFISGNGSRPVTEPRPADGPRPDTVNVPEKTFSSNDVLDTEEGLFVSVRDGHVELLTAVDVLHLGKGETGFVDPRGNPARPVNIPKFIDFDTVTLPGARHSALASVLANAGLEFKLCR